MAVAAKIPDVSSDFDALIYIFIGDSLLPKNIVFVFRKILII